MASEMLGGVSSVAERKGALMAFIPDDDDREGPTVSLPIRESSYFGRVLASSPLSHKCVAI